MGVESAHNLKELNEEDKLNLSLVEGVPKKRTFNEFIQKDLTKEDFFLGSIGSFDITRRIVPLYKEMKKSDAERRLYIINNFL